MAVCFPAKGTHEGYPYDKGTMMGTLTMRLGG
jgi:hypothetical protein